MRMYGTVREILELIMSMDARRLDDAMETYQKVLELDPRHAVALGFLGMVYHLKGNLDQAIVKYHEVRITPTPPRVQLHLHFFSTTIRV